MEAFGKFCFAILLIVIGVLLGGFVLMKLWAWFVSDVFNLPKLSLVQAIGVSVVVGYFKQPQAKNKDDKDEELWKLLVKAILVSALWLLFGYVVHLVS